MPKIRMKLDDLITQYQEPEFGDWLKIRFDQWDQIPQRLALKNFHVMVRQREISNGLIDNLIIETSPASSTFLGLWLLGCQHQKAFETYSLDVEDSTSDIKTIDLELPDEELVDVSLNAFTWDPALMDDYKSHPVIHHGRKPNVIVSNRERQWGTEEEFRPRDTLVIEGRLGATCVLSEFFLNFGHLGSNVNYAYLKFEWANSLLDEHSCEIRVEVAGAKDGGMIQRKKKLDA